VSQCGALKRHQFRDKVEDYSILWINKSGGTNEEDDAEGLIWEERRATQEWTKREHAGVAAESERSKGTEEGRGIVYWHATLARMYATENVHRLAGNKGDLFV